MISRLVRSLRFSILLVAIFIAIAVYVWFGYDPGSTLGTVALVKTYALLASGCIFLALMVSPLLMVFPMFKWRGQLTLSRRAIGVSGWMFASLHVYFAFFKLLGGFAGLSYLSAAYQWYILIGATAWTILLLMAGTSFEYMIRKMHYPHWKLLHRFVYLAVILIVVHALALGDDFITLSASPVAKISFTLLSVLVLLEALRIDRFLAIKMKVAKPFGVATLIVTIGIVLALGSFFHTSSGGGFNIHTQHIQLAQDVQNAANQPQNISIPGLRGDRTLRYSVGLTQPASIQPGVPASFHFAVSNAANGDPVRLFTRAYEKYVHLIVVDSTLEQFQHLHPDVDGAGFTGAVTFPSAGYYRMYVDFQPLGAIEQQFGFLVKVGDATAAPATQTADTTRTKLVNGYTVTLTAPKLQATKLSVGEQKLLFTISDQAGKPVTDLKPYLGAFGHLVMINEQTYEYIHVHPTLATLLPANATGGPDVEFMPLGIYAPIKAGTYRVFAQFNPRGTLIVADFTITVE